MYKKKLSISREPWRVMCFFFSLSFFLLSLFSFGVRTYPPLFRDRRSFALIFRSFLRILSFRSVLFIPRMFCSVFSSFFHSFSGTSTNQFSSSALFFPLYPQRGTHSPVVSSYTIFFRRSLSASTVPGFVLYLPIPFFRAKRSHFVGGFAVGTGL